MEGAGFPQYVGASRGLRGSSVLSVLGISNPFVDRVGRELAGIVAPITALHPHESVFAGRMHVGLQLFDACASAGGADAGL